MPIQIEGETYYTVSEAAEYLGISRPTFYQNVVKEKRISEYKHGALRRNYYRKSDLDQYKGFRPSSEGQDGDQ